MKANIKKISLYLVECPNCGCTVVEQAYISLEQFRELHNIETCPYCKEHIELNKVEYW